LLRLHEKRSLAGLFGEKGGEMTDIVRSRPESVNVALSRRPAPNFRHFQGKALFCFGQFCRNPACIINVLEQERLG